MRNEIRIIANIALRMGGLFWFVRVDIRSKEEIAAFFISFLILLLLSPPLSSLCIFILDIFMLKILSQTPTPTTTFCLSNERELFSFTQVETSTTNLQKRLEAICQIFHTEVEGRSEKERKKYKNSGEEKKEQ